MRDGNAEEGGGIAGEGMKGRRRGLILLRALTAAFKGNVIRTAFLLVLVSAAHIFQVRKSGA